MARNFRRKNRIRAEVNLTPLIDVMMSLLAIFMITAPLLTTGIPLTLPKGDGKTIEGQEKTLDIGITKDDKIYVGTSQRDCCRKPANQYYHQRRYKLLIRTRD